MKKGYIKLLIVNSLIISVLLISSFLSPFHSYKLIFFLLFCILIIYFLFGYQKRKKRYQKDILLIVLIHSISYFIIIYLFGLKIGFNRSSFNLSFIPIVKNITPAIIIIILSEYMRYMVTSKASKYKLILVLSTAIFILIDTIKYIPIYTPKLASDILKFIIIVVIPSISKNILLTYISVKSGYKPAILYRFIFELNIFLLPIFPDVGLYVGSLLYMLFPAFLTYRIYRYLDKLKQKEVLGHKKRDYNTLIILLVSTFLLPMIILTSNFFKYYALTIGSGSMRPSINVGDVLIVKKLNTEEIKYLENGELLVFRYENKVIVHRIVRSIYIKGEYLFYTKGDNNEGEDGYPISTNNIIGVAVYKIPYIGYPTVLLNELFY